MTFGYDTSNTVAGIYTMGSIREKALQLLDDLVKLREDPNSVRTFIFTRFYILLLE
jgi:hypothetical protein